MDDPGTRVAPGNRMACALPGPCVTGLLSPCPPIFLLCPSLSLLHAPGLCCSSHLPRPGQARGHCRGSLMPGVFFLRVLQPFPGRACYDATSSDGPSRLHVSPPSPCHFSLFPWKAGATVLVTRRLQASGALGPPSVNAWATHLTLISRQPREILQGPRFLG